MITLERLLELGFEEEETTPEANEFIAERYPIRVCSDGTVYFEKYCGECHEWDIIGVGDTEEDLTLLWKVLTGKNITDKE